MTCTYPIKNHKNPIKDNETLAWYCISQLIILERERERERELVIIKCNASEEIRSTDRSDKKRKQQPMCTWYVREGLFYNTLVGMVFIIDKISY